MHTKWWPRFTTQDRKIRFASMTFEDFWFQVPFHWIATTMQSFYFVHQNMNKMKILLRTAMFLMFLQWVFQFRDEFNLRSCAAFECVYVSHWKTKIWILLHQIRAWMPLFNMNYIVSMVNLFVRWPVDWVSTLSMSIIILRCVRDSIIIVNEIIVWFSYTIENCIRTAEIFLFSFLLGYRFWSANKTELPLIF